MTIYDDILALSRAASILRRESTTAEYYKRKGMELVAVLLDDLAKTLDMRNPVAE